MNELSLFNTLFGGALDDTMQFSNFNTSTPNVDVAQTDNAYTVEMELPGRTQNDINIELDHNVLKISSIKEEVKTTSDKDAKTQDNSENKEVLQNKEQPTKEVKKWLLKERKFSSFSRSFSMPDDIDSENVSASFKNGVLNVIIPRKAKVAPKRISITA